MFAEEIPIPAYEPSTTLRLVKPDVAFAPTTTNWIRNTEVTQYLGADFSEATEEDEVSHLAKMLVDEDCYSWMIELEGAIVGNVELNEIAKLSEKYAMKSAGLCMVIGNPDNWGKGLGAFAQQAACNWAFTSGGFDLVEAKAYVQNERSWRSLANLGYRYCCLEDDEVNKQPVQWKVFTLTKQDWAEFDWPTKQ